MTTTTNWFNLHGISIRVNAADEVMHALSRRLLSFVSDHPGSPDLDFTFTEQIIDSLSAGRTVYELEGGKVVYHAERDILTASYHGSVSMICNIEDGVTEYMLADNAEGSRMASRLLFTLPLVETLRHRGLYNLHAAGLCRGNDAVLLAGPSGAGKSTLTLEMTRAGWGYMGDDMLFLKSECPGVFGFPEGIDYFTHLPGTPGKAHLRPETAFHTAALMQAKPSALIFPRVAHTVQSRLTEMDRTEAFLELAPNVLMTSKSRCERHFRVLESLTRTTPAYRLHTGTNLPLAERMIGDLVEQLSR